MSSNGNIWSKRVAAINFLLMFMVLFSYFTLGLSSKDLYREVDAEYPQLPMVIALISTFYCLAIGILSMTNKSFQIFLGKNTSQNNSNLFGKFPTNFTGILFLSTVISTIAIILITLPIYNLSVNI